jgi:hypothetical protein
MKNLIQAAVVTLFAASTAQAQQAVQWKVSDGGNGHWYQWIHQLSGVSWAMARDACLDDGGHLATPTSMAENQFVFGLTLPTSLWPYRFGPWLGGYQDLAAADFSEPAGGWRWVTGEAWAWTAWWPGEPTNFYCVTSGEDKLHYIDYQPMWNDITNLAGDCEQPNWSYIVEWSADCNSDGIVDYGQCLDGSLPDYNGDNVPDCCERNEPCTVGYYPRQWRVEDGGNGHWYELVISGPLTWGAARNRAETRGGYLATPTSPAENAFIIPLANHPEAWVQDCCGNTNGPWLGGYQPLDAAEQAPWKWVSDEPWGWAGWAAGEPNNGYQPGILVTMMAGYPPLNQSYRGWADAYATGTSPQDSTTYPVSLSYIAEYSADCNNDGIVDYGQILTGQLADLDSNGVPDICQQPTCVDADIYRDFNVNGADLGILLSQWGPNTPLTESDLNNDGVVNGADLGILLSFWGACP